MDINVIAKVLRYFGLIGIVIGTFGWIAYDREKENKVIGDLFFKDLRAGIEKLSNVGNGYDHQTLTESEFVKSYHAILKVIKRNAQNLKYEHVTGIESKAITKYRTWAEVESPVINLVSPPITLLSSIKKGEQPVTTLDVLKSWITAYEMSQYLMWIFISLFIGIVFQFLGSEYGYKVTKIE